MLDNAVLRVLMRHIFMVGTQEPVVKIGRAKGTYQVLSVTSLP